MTRAHLMHRFHAWAYACAVAAIGWLERAKLRHDRRASFWGTLEIARRAQRPQ